MDGYVNLSNDLWVQVLEQLLLVILIFGRWLLPKGDLSRDQLSQLLLVYIGMAADIVEFFEAFKEPEVRFNLKLIYIILGMWSWSLLQFTLILTGARKTRGGTSTMKKKKKPHGPKKKKKRSHCCGMSDIWAIFITLMLQDGPFLVLRLLLIFYYKVVSYMNIFFTCKNALVTILQVYRMFVLCYEAETPPSSVHSKQQKPKGYTGPQKAEHGAKYCVSSRLDNGGFDAQAQAQAQQPLRSSRSASSLVKVSVIPREKRWVPSETRHPQERHAGSAFEQRVCSHPRDLDELEYDRRSMQRSPYDRPITSYEELRRAYELGPSYARKTPSPYGDSEYRNNSQTCPYEDDHLRILEQLSEYDEQNSPYNNRDRIPYSPHVTTYDESAPYNNYYR